MLSILARRAQLRSDRLEHARPQHRGGQPQQHLHSLPSLPDLELRIGSAQARAGTRSRSQNASQESTASSSCSSQQHLSPPLVSPFGTLATTSDPRPPQQQNQERERWNALPGQAVPSPTMSASTASSSSVLSTPESTNGLDSTSFSSSRPGSRSPRTMSPRHTTTDAPLQSGAWVFHYQQPHATPTASGHLTPSPISPLPVSSAPGSRRSFVAQSAADYEAALQRVERVATHAHFAALARAIKRPSELDTGASLLVFRDGIRPAWEDPANAQGGKWTLAIRPQGAAAPASGTVGAQQQLDACKALIDLAWSRLLSALASGRLASDVAQNGTALSREICGACLAIRPRGDRIQLWVRASGLAASHMYANEAIEQTLAVGRLNSLASSLIALLGEASAMSALTAHGVHVSLEFSMHNTVAHPNGRVAHPGLYRFEGSAASVAMQSGALLTATAAPPRTPLTPSPFYNSVTGSASSTWPSLVQPNNSALCLVESSPPHQVPPVVLSPMPCSPSSQAYPSAFEASLRPGPESLLHPPLSSSSSAPPSRPSSAMSNLSTASCRTSGSAASSAVSATSSSNAGSERSAALRSVLQKGTDRRRRGVRVELSPSPVLRA